MGFAGAGMPGKDCAAGVSAFPVSLCKVQEG